MEFIMCCCRGRSRTFITHQTTAKVYNRYNEIMKSNISRNLHNLRFTQIIMSLTFFCLPVPAIATGNLRKHTRCFAEDTNSYWAPFTRLSICLLYMSSQPQLILFAFHLRDSRPPVRTDGGTFKGLPSLLVPCGVRCSTNALRLYKSI